MTVEDVIKALHNIEDRANDFPNMTDSDWVAIAAAKRHLLTLKPNYENLVYTKQELKDMGFGFDLNGNISTPQEIQERTKKYINYRKDKWIKKACDWLSLNMTDVAYFGMNGDLYKPEFIQEFKQAMEE